MSKLKGGTLRIGTGESLGVQPDSRSAWHGSFYISHREPVLAVVSPTTDLPVLADTRMRVLRPR